MIDGLIAGKLYGIADTRTGRNGTPFTTAKVRAAAGDGEGMFVSVITFSTTVGDALMALGDGDSVALAGSLTPKVWTDRQGNTKPTLDMIAHQVLTAYHVTKKRKAVAPPSASPSPGGDFADEHGSMDF